MPWNADSGILPSGPSLSRAVIFPGTRVAGQLTKPGVNAHRVNYGGIARKAVAPICSVSIEETCVRNESMAAASTGNTGQPTQVLAALCTRLPKLDLHHRMAHRILAIAAQTHTPSACFGLKAPNSKSRTSRGSARKAFQGLYHFGEVIVTQIDFRNTRKASVRTRELILNQGPCETGLSAIRSCGAAQLRRRMASRVKSSKSAAASVKARTSSRQAAINLAGGLPACCRNKCTTRSTPYSSPVPRASKRPSL
jgi:hypothetical protein